MPAGTRPEHRTRSPSRAVGAGRRRRHRWGSARAALVLAGMAVVSAVAAQPASAHPLGNFSVNHYHELTIAPDGIDVLAVVDTAEIPTRQARPAIDADGNGQMDADELAATADRRCRDLAAALAITIDGDEVAFEVGEVAMVPEPGAAGLDTLRLTCRLSAPVEVAAGTVVEVVDDYDQERVGWREMVVVEDGVAVESSLPSTSVSDQLRSYPEELLASPLNVRSATITVVSGDAGPATQAESLAGAGDPFSRMVAAGDRMLEDTIGRDELTPLVGGLAILLAMVLGAGHAMLPGHGKTVMAAYLAGRRGSRTDAFIVGGTVTLTHTAGVLLLGLLLTVGTAVAGEVILQRLGLVSGLLIAGIGVGLVRDALRARRRRAEVASGSVLDPAVTERRGGPDAAVVAAGAAGTARAGDMAARAEADEAGAGSSHAARPGHGAIPLTAHGHGFDGHGFDGHGFDGHDHPLGHAPDHRESSGLDEGPGHGHDDSRGHGHGHDDDHGHDHGHEHVGSHGHGHGHGHTHGPLDGDPRFTRRGLVGMAVAGGLVPSPSALVVLLGSVALGRTLFGTILVLAYGVGMAGTLTAVGLVLVRLRRRLDQAGGGGRLANLFGRLSAILPLATAGLVLVVGLGLVVRALLVGA